ncbi:FecR family protein [Pseudozobellia thermophila]|uniref:FecR family protein n=1 Tax=Pseudozobellia thermophila TaxID=192903 RepID=A0A1M6BC82_9FLAO|nr:FecR family protein [Pseudozobellia thermophila]SHI46296.1 FecR family protein [Pseudozobellia thermophila]
MKIEKIIVKFLNSEADIHELEKLDAWLKDKKNENLFNGFVKTDYIARFTMDQYDLNAAKESIRANIERRQQAKRRRRYSALGIAASLALLISTGYFYLNSGKEEKGLKMEVAKEDKSIEPGKNKAILTLDNGDQIVLGKGRAYEDHQLRSDGDKVKYRKGDADSKSIPYNQLSVPKGGQFYLELADGTAVWLNSESKIKYPTKFEKGKPREVDLMYGEAFFKVSDSRLHDGATFNVMTRFQNVTVLGTEFNIKAYKEDPVIKTTLVEGSVEIYKDQVSKRLEPDQQSVTSEGHTDIQIKPVDAKQEVSWIEGLFSFNDEPLEDIMKTLSRWYDIEVVFESAEKKKHTFTGIVERSESIYDLLELIERTSNNQIKFKTDEKTIVIQ